MPAPFQPIVINFASYKGGGGRTTTAMSVAAALVLQARNVLVVDLDFEAPGVTLFAGEGDTGGWIRLRPDTLRPLGLERAWRAPRVETTQVRLSGIIDVLAETIVARSGGDILNVIDRGNFRDNLDRITGWWQSGTRSQADDATEVEKVIAERVATGEHIFEYVPLEEDDRSTATGNAPRLPGRLFFLPLGGHFRRLTSSASWIYESDRLAPEGIERSDPAWRAWERLLQEDLARELSRRDVNLTTAFVAGIGKIMRRHDVRLDAILIDYRPGSDPLTMQLGTVGHGTVFVSPAARGALAGTWNFAQKLVQLCAEDAEKAKRGVAPVVAFMVEKIIEGGGQPQDVHFGAVFRDSIKAIGIKKRIGDLIEERLLSDHVAAFRSPFPDNAWQSSLQFALSPLVGGRTGQASNLQPSGPDSVHVAWQNTKLDGGDPELDKVFQSIVPVFFDQDEFPFFETTHDLATWSLRANVRPVLERSTVAAFNGAIISLVAAGLRDLATEAELKKFVYFEHPPVDLGWNVLRALGRLTRGSSEDELIRIVDRDGSFVADKPQPWDDWTLPYHLAEACLLIADRRQGFRVDYADRARKFSDQALECFEKGHIRTRYAEAEWAIKAVAARANMAWAEAGNHSPADRLKAFSRALREITAILTDDREGYNATSVSWIIRSQRRQSPAEAQATLRDDRRRRLIDISLGWINALFTGPLRVACKLDDTSGDGVKALEGLLGDLLAWLEASGLPTPSAPAAPIDPYLDLGARTIPDWPISLDWRTRGLISICSTNWEQRWATASLRRQTSIGRNYSDCRVSAPDCFRCWSCGGGSSLRISRILRARPMMSSASHKTTVERNTSHRFGAELP